MVDPCTTSFNLKSLGQILLVVLQVAQHDLSPSLVIRGERFQPGFRAICHWLSSSHLSLGQSFLLQIVMFFLSCEVGWIWLWKWVRRFP